MTSILVAGVGNIFLGDDAFGCEVARSLAGAALPDEVQVRDYGTGGVHLAHDVAAGVELLILIDTVPEGDQPGEVSVFEVDEPEDAPAHQGALLDAHSMDPVSMLDSVRALGAELPRTLVVGCRPETVAEGIGLSAPVQSAVGPARQCVLDLIERELSTLTDDASMKE